MVRFSLELFSCFRSSCFTLGTFVRYGPNRVSINSANALRDIYAVNANVQKSKAYSTYKHFFGKDMSMTMTDRKEHASRRRIHGRAQRPEAIEAMQEKIIHNVRIFCASLVESESPNNWSSAKNLTKIVGYLVSDIMGDITFSRNWNTQKDPQYRHFVEDSALGTAGIHLVSQRLHSRFRTDNFRRGTCPAYLNFTYTTSSSVH